METIFDCKFSPNDPNLLATASFDGTIKVWDVTTLHAVSTSGYITITVPDNQCPVANVMQ